MDSPFIYDRFVSGKNFVGRKNDVNSLANLLEAGEHVAMYEPPKSGKMSLIQQTLFNMRVKGLQFMVGQLDLFNVRTLDAFLLKFASSVIRPICSTPGEYSAIVSRFLEGTHFVFDSSRFASDSEEIISLNWEADHEDLARMIRLPQRLAAERGVPFYMVISEFQNIMKIDGWEDIFKEMEKVLSESVQSPSVSFIMSGSMVNAMKFIFEEKKFFYRMHEHLPLSRVDDREIIDHIVRGFMLGGKVVDRELILGACTLFKGNLWYLNHFSAVCDSLSKGYMNEPILMEALSTIISIHEPRFKAMVDDLTDFQMSLVRATIDGVVKFSASDVIERYKLNSSANVRRLKDALRKKEIISFDEKDEPYFLDPLFQYWLEKYYYCLK